MLIKRPGGFFSAAFSPQRVSLDRITMRTHPLRRLVAAAALFALTGLPPRSLAVVIDLVPVGNPGNAGEVSGASLPGGNGPDRICGAVDYNYDIGKSEITAGQYTAFLNAVARTDAYGLYNVSMSYTPYGCGISRTGTSGSYAYSVSSSRSNRPVAWVGWGDAARFCNWLHNGQPSGSQGLSTTEDGSYYLNGATTATALMAVTRKTNATWYIPTEDEWYKTAYHKNDGATTNYWRYPTRSDSVPGRDLSESANPGNNANYYGTPFPIESGTYYTTLAGEFQLSPSPYGTFDQGGNVCEWVETGLSGSARGLRGGSFFGSSSTLLAACRSGADPTSESSDWGFRVVNVPAAPPTLLISLDYTNVNLSWSTNCPDFTLERTDQLTNLWSPVSGTTNCSATVSLAAATNQFFRLRK
jgi:formylglycine-generating enzyme